MGLPGIAETAVTVVLIGVIWLAGVVLIKAADLVEMNRTAALAKSRPRRLSGGRTTAR